MLTVTRETLIEHLVELPEIVDLYEGRDPAFPTQVLKWLGRIEQSLGRLRTPLLSAVTAQRALLLASMDGFQDPRITSDGGRSRSAARRDRATAALCLDRVEAALRGAIEKADDALRNAREKMLQLLALASAEQSLPMPSDEPRQVWLQNVWRALRNSAETQSLYAYLSAALQPSDRLYLLEDLLSNLLQDADAPPAA